jgi:hypothetical protein
MVSFRKEADDKFSVDLPSETINYFGGADNASAAGGATMAYRHG